MKYKIYPYLEERAYMNNLINDINNERKLEARCIQFRKDAMPIMKDLKTLYDVSIDEGFNEYQATVFTNTYFSAVLAGNFISK